MKLFINRKAAGVELGVLIRQQKMGSNPAVLALPRGGVPIGAEVADAIRGELDVIAVRKLGVPGQPEFAMGAISWNGATYLNDQVIHALGISEREVEAVRESESIELNRRNAKYRGSDRGYLLEGRTVILVDDGMATGATMFAAVAAVRQMNPRQIIVGVPVAPPELRAEFEEIVDKYVCVLEPENFGSVGQFYETFEQVSDDEVLNAIEQFKSSNRKP